MPIKVNEREYRDIDLRNIEFRTMEDGTDVVEGYATTWDEYLLWDDGDYRLFEKFDRHAFDNCDLSDIIMQLNHEGRVYARGSNKTLTVEPDDKGLKIRAYLGAEDAVGAKALKGDRGVCALASGHIGYSSVVHKGLPGLGYLIHIH